MNPAGEILKTAIIALVIMAGPAAVRSSAIERDDFRLGGYVRGMPSVRMDEDFSDPAFATLVHNRLNFRWDVSESVDLDIEGRNRLFYNESFRRVPDIRGLFGRDDGLVDMSWVWLSGGSWLGHSEVDRLFLSWRAGDWRVRAGRQRVNWGINLVSNPNDLFNVYSFFDFDYEERPGADALRVQHYLSHLSSIEIAGSPARDDKESVAATRYSFNHLGYDFQAIAGYYRDRSALGGGWAGNIGEAGFKGEATWFYDLDRTPGVRRGNVVAAAGLDYMFAGGTFSVIELLYNGGHDRRQDDVFSVTEPLRADNIMFSEYAVTVSADRSFSPILSGGVSAMWLPDIEAGFLRPRIEYSVMRDLDFEVVAQVFAGGRGTILENAGIGLFASLQHSF